MVCGERVRAVAQQTHTLDQPGVCVVMQMQASSAAADSAGSGSKRTHDEQSQADEGSADKDGNAKDGDAKDGDAQVHMGACSCTLLVAHAAVALCSFYLSLCIKSIICMSYPLAVHVVSTCSACRCSRVLF